MLVKIRQSERYPTSLKDDQGNPVTGHNNIAQLVSTYFAEFFGSVGPAPLHWLGPRHLSKFFTTHTQLDDPFSLDEVKRALFSMNSFKAPGPDGIQAHFYKYGWEVVKSSLLDFAKHVLAEPEELSKVNSTFISLIP